MFRSGSIRAVSTTQRIVALEQSTSRNSREVIGSIGRPGKMFQKTK